MSGASKLSDGLSVPVAEAEAVETKNLGAALNAARKVPGVQNHVTGKVIAFESTDRGQFGWFPIILASTTDRNGNSRVPALKGEFKVWAARAHDSGPDDRGPILSDGPPPAVLPQVVDFATGSGGLGGHLPGGGMRQELKLLAGPGGRSVAPSPAWMGNRPRAFPSSSTQRSGNCRETEPASRLSSGPRPMPRVLMP